MKLMQNIEIMENIITASIKAVELGTAQIDSATELNQLHNYVKYIEYGKIEFSANIKLANGAPTVTSNPTDGTSIEKVSISNIISKKIVLDENFEARLSVDVGKIAESDYANNKVINTPELMGQAYAVIFIDKIKTAVSEKLAEIRALDNNIENTTDVIL